MTNYILHLADNALVLGHRNSEWTGHGPILEQDIALSNISLDLIGQARNLYQYAAELKGNGATEDSLAYLRSADEYKNCLMVELPNGHWGKTILRQFFFSAYQYPLYQLLSSVKNDTVRAIAVKSLKEVTYHLRWSSEWVVRLGKGTEESHSKMTDAVNELWPFTENLITSPSYDPYNNESSQIKDAWQSRVYDVMTMASLSIPKNVQMIDRNDHTEHLHSMLSEMQHLQRNYPGVEW